MTALPKAASAIVNVSCDWLIPADNPAMAPIMAAAGFSPGLKPK